MFYVSTLINIDIFSILNQAKDGKAHRHSKAKQKKCNMRREHIQTNTEACHRHVTSQLNSHIVCHLVIVSVS